MDLDCYYVTDWGCLAGSTDCKVCIDPWQSTVIYDDGCIIIIDIPWQDVFTEQLGEFVCETL